MIDWIGRFQAEYAAAEVDCEDTVIRSGKFFEVDREFVDRKGARFSISADEADERIRRFTPRAINLQHVPTIFDGLLGQVRRLWRDGVDICAEYEIPRWLHEITRGEPLKVSSEWDIVTKEPVAAALVLKPALQDAVIRAAFSAAQVADPEGQAPPGASPPRPHQSGNRSGSERNGIRTDKEKNQTMAETNSLMDRMRALLSRAGLPADDGERAQFQSGGRTPPNRAEVEALAQRVAELSAESRMSEAMLFAEQMVREHRAVPAEKPALVAAYCRAAEDDAAHGGTVQFAAGDGSESSLSRVETLKAIYTARPDHSLTAELLRDTLALAAANSQELTALFSQPTTLDPDAPKPLDRSRRRALHEMTALGQQTLKDGH